MELKILGQQVSHLINSQNFIFERFKTEEMDFSGINEMETDDDQFQITVQNGTLVINDSIGNAIVNVSDMQGRVVYNGYEREISGLARGLYIVRIGNLTTKIVI